MTNYQRVLRVLDAPAQNRVDVHVKQRVPGEDLQLLIQHLEALLRDLVRHDVVDADLHVVEPGLVEALNSVGREQITVGDQARQRAVLSHARDEVVEFRMQQRLAPAERDDGGAQLGQPVKPLEHHVFGDRLGAIVVLITVGAGEIAAANGNDVRHHRVPGGERSLQDQPEFPQAPFQRADVPAKMESRVRHP